jgi:hypothetical protein
MIGDGTYVYAAPFPDAVDWWKPPAPIDIKVYFGDGPNPFVKYIGKRAEEIAALRAQLADVQATIRILSEVLRELAARR